MYSLKTHKGFDGERIKLISEVFDSLRYMPRFSTQMTTAEKNKFFRF